MGFIRGNVLPILKEHKLRPFKGLCLCLGQADVYFTFEHLQRMADIAEVTLRPGGPITPSYRPDFAAKNYISGETLFKAIGFSEVYTLDVSAFEGADFQFDLNASTLPQHLENKFDVIINHGTMEHVFHIPNFLDNVNKMLKVGGRVIHIAPASNYLDHGFYMISPTFFYDYYKANKWRLNTIQIIKIMNVKLQEVEASFIADYEPGIFDTIGAGGLDDKTYAVFCIATKEKESTGSAIPQQGYYIRQDGWQTGLAVTKTGEKGRVIPRIKKILKSLKRNLS